MEILRNTREREPKASLKQLLLRRAEEKKDRALEGRGSGYSPRDVKNVRQNYQVVREYLERLLDKNFEDMAEVISNLNMLAEDKTKFPNINDEVDVNGQYKILAIYPPEIDIFSAIRKTPRATTFIAGTNFWDNPFNPRQVFLPVNYILEKV